MTELFSSVKFYMFTKDSCGPCGLVKRYINALKDDRAKIIEEIYLEDFSDEPIPEENLALAKKYGVTATPVLIIELGDLLWYVAQATQALGISFDEVIATNVKKLEKRYPDGAFDIYFSENRAADDR